MSPLYKYSEWHVIPGILYMLVVAAMPICIALLEWPVGGKDFLNTWFPLLLALALACLFPYTRVIAYQDHLHLGFSLLPIVTQTVDSEDIRRINVRMNYGSIGGLLGFNLVEIKTYGGRTWIQCADPQKVASALQEVYLRQDRNR